LTRPIMVFPAPTSAPYSHLRKNQKKASKSR